jgi:hypothetical protein
MSGKRRCLTSGTAGPIAADRSGRSACREHRRLTSPPGAKAERHASSDLIRGHTRKRSLRTETGGTPMVERDLAPRAEYGGAEPYLSRCGRRGAGRRRPGTTDLSHGSRVGLRSWGVVEFRLGREVDLICVDSQGEIPRARLGFPTARAASTRIFSHVRQGYSVRWWRPRCPLEHH